MPHFKSLHESNRNGNVFENIIGKSNVLLSGNFGMLEK